MGFAGARMQPREVCRWIGCPSAHPLWGCLSICKRKRDTAICSECRLQEDCFGSRVVPFSILSHLLRLALGAVCYEFEKKVHEYLRGYSTILLDLTPYPTVRYSIRRQEYVGAIVDSFLHNFEFFCRITFGNLSPLRADDSGVFEHRYAALHYGAAVQSWVWVKREFLAPVQRFPPRTWRWSSPSILYDAYTARNAIAREEWERKTAATMGWLERTDDNQNLSLVGGHCETDRHLDCSHIPRNHPHWLSVCFACCQIWHECTKGKVHSPFFRDGQPCFEVSCTVCGLQ